MIHDLPCLRPRRITQKRRSMVLGWGMGKEAGTARLSQVYLDTPKQL
jgi:hypothetical protein